MAKDPARISVVGSSNIDLTFRTPRLPRPGETLAGRSFVLGFGGKGANQAVMASRLGSRVTMIGRVGRDVFGQQTLENFRAQGIDTTYLLVDEEQPTGTAAIVVDDLAQNCIIVVAGANHALSPRHVQAAAAALQAAQVLICQLEVPLETTLEALRLARAAGVRTILNPAPAGALPDDLLHLCDILIPNETEAELLTGKPVTTPAEAETAARCLRDRGAHSIIVTLGRQGVLLFEGQTAEHLPAIPVQALDPTGAGDAFIGGLAVFLAEDCSLREASLQANAVAALSVTRAGAQAAFPRRAEVEKFLTR